MSEFESKVLPVIERYARLRLGQNEELIAVSVVLGWWYWQQTHARKPELSASAYAKAAVRSALAGRDLPGVQASKFPDVWGKLGRVEGGDMAGVQDRRPGPERLAEWGEEWDAIYATLTPCEKALADAVREGVYRTDELAQLLGVSPGRVSQLRRQVMEKSK